MYKFNNNQDPSYKGYIRATQNAIVRFDPSQSPESVSGICTDRLDACLGILILSDVTNRKSLIHTDTGFSTDDILKECNWVDDAHSVRIILCRGLNIVLGNLLRDHNYTVIPFRGFKWL